MCIIRAGLYLLLFIEDFTLFFIPQVDRHLKSKCHSIAIELERASSENILETECIAGPSQPTIDSIQKTSINEAYKKLMVTAYELCLHPTMPLNHFRILVELQRKNGVCFIEGE